MPARAFPFLVLGLGVVVVSFAAILIRFSHAEGASSLAIAAVRLAVAAMVIAPFAWLRAATFEEFKQAAERAFLVGKLQEHDWNVSETARALQMPRSNLYKKIERYGLRGGEGGPS